MKKIIRLSEEENTMEQVAKVCYALVGGSQAKENGIWIDDMDENWKFSNFFRLFLSPKKIQFELDLFVCYFNWKINSLSLEMEKDNDQR